MIPSPFTAELARQHRAALVVAPGRPPASGRRERLRAAAAEIPTLLARAAAGAGAPGRAACATC